MVASNGTWSYTPTAPFANGALDSDHATQAVAGGPSSAAATDSFTVNATGGLTISTAPNCTRQFGRGQQSANDHQHRQRNHVEW